MPHFPQQRKQGNSLDTVKLHREQGRGRNKSRVIIHSGRRIARTTIEKSRQICSIERSIGPPISASFCPRRPFQRRRMIKSSIESHLFSAGGTPWGTGAMADHKTRTFVQSCLRNRFIFSRQKPFSAASVGQHVAESMLSNVATKHRLTKKIRVAGLPMKQKRAIVCTPVSQSVRSAWLSGDTKNWIVENGSGAGIGQARAESGYPFDTASIFGKCFSTRVRESV